MRSLFTLICCAVISIAFSQTPTYDDITFDEEEIGAAFKAPSKQHITLKSKKGTGGMPKVPEADALKGAEVTDIILVFTETSEDASVSREDNNRERWENLLNTYPEFFQFSTNYKNVCQCVMGGDAENLKPMQGFYIYYKTAEQKAAEKAAQAAAKQAAEKKELEEAKAAEKKVEKKEEPKKEEKKEEKVAKSEPKKEKEKEKEKEKVVEKPKEEKKKKEEEKKEEEVVETSTAVEGSEETVTVEIKPKRQGYKKPKVSKDKKACRPPCYGTSDEDLHVFFKENITLDKKMRRAIKGSQCIVKLSLNFDGSIKKAMVNGTNAKLNEYVTTALKSMDLWYPAVKGGVTVKSEVKITLKYDKSTKAVKPFEVMITPRPNPKCTECRTDAEIFGE